MPQLDPSTFAPQLIWLAITFVVLYVLMARVALPRIEAVLEVRADRIADDLDTAEGMNKKANEALKGYQEALADARVKAQEIAAQNRARVQADIAAHRDRLKAELGVRISQAEADIETASREAQAHVGEIAAEAAGFVVAHLIGISPDSSIVAQAVEAELAASSSEGGA